MATVEAADAAGLAVGDHLRLLREFPDADWPGILGAIAARRQAGESIRNPAGLCRTMARDGFTPPADGRQKGKPMVTAAGKRKIAAVQAAKDGLRRLWGLPAECDLSGEAWKVRWPDVTAEQKAEWDRRVILAAKAAEKAES